jgi:broad specificity phosphatase PhoE
MHIHNKPRPIYFSRHGESLYNTQDKVGGDPDLSQRGYKYAANLNIFLQDEMKQRKINKNSKFFSSTLRRTIITAGHVDIGIQAVPLKRLDEINTGAYDGLTYSEIEEKYPSEAEERKKDKLRYRYPEGESYLDIIQRVEPVIFAIEKSKEPVIIVNYFKN